jgi:hypothetical protein
VFVLTRQSMNVSRTTEARVTLFIQDATRMRHIVFLLVASLPPPHFSPFSHKRHDFQENVIEHKMCVLIFSTTFM